MNNGLNGMVATDLALDKRGRQDPLLTIGLEQRAATVTFVLLKKQQGP